MKRLSALLTVGALLLTGCSSTQTTQTPPPEPTASPMRFGAADSLGWSLYNSDRALAAHAAASDPDSP